MRQPQWYYDEFIKLTFAFLASGNFDSLLIHP